MPGKYKFQRERLGEMIDEAMPLFFDHYKEIAHYQDIPLKPAFEVYYELDGANQLHVYTVRISATNELVGYALFFVKPNLHYSGSLQAQQDILFVHPKHRGFGRLFINWCDDQLRTAKVQAVYHHVKSRHNFGPLLERSGYEVVDIIFSKRLDK